MNSTRRLNAHVRTVHKKTKKCPFCERVFGRSDNLEKHIEMKHPGTADLKYFCSKCGDGFMYKNNLNRHNSEVHKKDTG